MSRQSIGGSRAHYSLGSYALTDEADALVLHHVLGLDSFVAGCVL
jgi:hypothetical protein